MGRASGVGGAAAPRPQFLGLGDMLDGGGAGRSGDTFSGGPLSGLLNALGIRPMGYRSRMGGLLDVEAPPSTRGGFSGGGPITTTTLPPPPAPSGPPLGSQPGAPSAAITRRAGPKLPTDNSTFVPSIQPMDAGLTLPEMVPHRGAVMGTDFAELASGTDGAAFAKAPQSRDAAMEQAVDTARRMVPSFDMLPFRLQAGIVNQILAGGSVTVPRGR